MSNLSAIRGIKRVRVFTIQAEKTEEEKIQKGIYCFLIKNSCRLIEMKKALYIYAKECKLDVPLKQYSKSVETNKKYAAISVIAQENFEAFKDCFNNNKKRIYVAERQSYDEWYEEASSDGSLAYNGSADDF